MLANEVITSISHNSPTKEIEAPLCRLPALTNHVEAKDMVTHDFRPEDRQKWMSNKNIIIGCPKYKVRPYDDVDFKSEKYDRSEKSSRIDKTEPTHVRSISNYSKMFSSNIPVDPWSNTLKYTKSIRSDKAIQLLMHLNNEKEGIENSVSSKQFKSVDSIGSVDKKFDISHNIHFVDKTPTEIDASSKYSRNKLYFKSLLQEYNKSHGKSQNP
jgi:hypothetical protein